mmetsp:Transcript_7171/g.30540  ORF Transcript_7171/g.30540 Transcript_7171/m.30540 type:complete len:263 (+) Transcript_7171:96-884(+)
MTNDDERVTPPRSRRYEVFASRSAKKAHVRKVTIRIRTSEHRLERFVPGRRGQVPDHAQRGLGRDALLGHRGDVRDGQGVDLRDELRRRLALAVGEDLPPDVLGDDGFGFQIHQDGRHRRRLRARELLLGDLAGRHGGHLVRHHLHHVARPVAVRHARDADHPDVVEHGMERRAVLRPRVFVQHARVQSGIHALPRPARAERAAAAHQRVQHGHRGGRLRVLPAARELERQHDVRDRGIGRHAVIAPDVLGRRRRRRRVARG